MNLHPRALATLLMASPGCIADTLAISEGHPNTQESGADPTTAATLTTTSSTPTAPSTSSIATPLTLDTASVSASDSSDTTDTSDTGDDTTTGPEGPHPELYPYDRVHSPITAYVADRMRAIAPQPDTIDTTFVKAGGTTTASPNFMHCLSDDLAIVGMPPELIDTRDFFNLDIGAGITSFTRDSLAAMTAWPSFAVASALLDELDALHPRFAHVLVGTHDLADEQPTALYTFADNLLDIVDTLQLAGTVPILSTIPQRTDMPAKTDDIPRYNAVIRAAAQGRQLPLVDLELALRTLPMTGLGPDGVDLSVFTSAMVDRPCFFDEVGLSNGYNVRNRESLVALDRAKRVVIDSETELDLPQPGLRGSGTWDDPYEIPALPFVDLRSTADSPSDAWDAYAGACDAAKDESGPEVVYRLATAALINLRATVFDRTGVDVDILILGAPAPETCLKRNDFLITGPLPEGEYYIVVDTFAGDVPGGAAGEYILTVLDDGP
mgnify:CR=1 FL=1